MLKRRLSERDIRGVVALRRGAVRQTPDGLRCLPVEPTPEERAQVLAEHAAWVPTGRSSPPD